MAKKNGTGNSASNPIDNTAPKAPSKNRAEGLKVLSTTSLSPAKVRLTEKFRGRAKPVDDATVVERADSIRLYGQQQPIQVRSVPGSDEYECIFGNTRKRAADLLVSGYVGGDGKTYEPKPDFLLRCEVVEVDDETALKRNLVENHERSATTAIDNALNHEMLRTTYGMSDAAITRFYGYAHQGTVTRLKKLLDLEQEYQDAISDGRMTAAAGFLLADEKVVAKENRGKVWLKVVDAVGKGGEDTASGINEGGAIGSSAMASAIKAFNKEVKEAAEAAKAADAPKNPDGTPVTPTEGPQPETPVTPEPAGPGRPSTGKIALTSKQFKETLAMLAKHPQCPDKCAMVCNMTVQLMSGEIDATAYAKFLKDTVGGTVPEPQPETPVTPETPAVSA